MSTVRRPPGISRPNFTTVQGISDRVGSPRLGKLRLGEKAKSASGKEYPKETDYFRCDPDKGMQPSEREKLIDKFASLYGERPTVVTDVFLPANDPDYVFPNNLEAWKRSEVGPKRWCHGNGVVAERLDFKSGTWSQMDCCHVQECPVMSAGECKLASRLRVYLPNVSIAGYWQIDTGSQASTGNIRDLINQLASVFGRLTNIPLVLSREPQVMTFEGKATTHYIVHMRAPNVDLGELRRLTATNPFLLPAGEQDILVDDDDLPEELVASSVQEPTADAETMRKIVEGFKVLGTKQVDQEVALHKYRGREADLSVAIQSRIDRAAVEGSSAL